MICKASTDRKATKLFQRQVDKQTEPAPTLRFATIKKPVPNSSQTACIQIRNRYSAGLRAGWPGEGAGSSPSRDWVFFSSLPRPDRLWGPPSLLSYGSFPGGKAVEAWSWPLLPQYVFMARCLIKYRDFTFTFHCPIHKSSLALNKVHGHDLGRSRDKEQILTPWSWVLLQNMIVAQLANNFPAFYGTLRLLPCSQERANGPYPYPDKSSPNLTRNFSQLHCSTYV
jgi:hypothetical protein